MKPELKPPPYVPCPKCERHVLREHVIGNLYRQCPLCGYRFSAKEIEK